MKSIPYLLGILGLCLMTSCASKQPKQITLRPSYVSEVAPIARNIERTTPGEVMDPDATVFAQVPKRIIFMPGEETLTSRTSAEQLAAYRLVKVSQIPEIQTNKPTTLMMTDPKASQLQGSQDVLHLTIKVDDVTEEGTARNLRAYTEEDIDIARSRLRKQETLRFLDGTGWVGWIPKGGNPGTANPLPAKNPNPPQTIQPMLTPTATPAPAAKPAPSATPEPIPPRLSPSVPPKTVPPALVPSGGSSKLPPMPPTKPTGPPQQKP